MQPESLTHYLSTDGLSFVATNYSTGTQEIFVCIRTISFFPFFLSSIDPPLQLIPVITITLKLNYCHNTDICYILTSFILCYIFITSLSSNSSTLLRQCAGTMSDLFSSYCYLSTLSVQLTHSPSCQPIGSLRKTLH